MALISDVFPKIIEHLVPSPSVTRVLSLFNPLFYAPIYNEGAFDYDGVTPLEEYQKYIGWSLVQYNSNINDYDFLGIITNIRIGVRGLENQPTLYVTADRDYVEITVRSYINPEPIQFQQYPPVKPLGEPINQFGIPLQVLGRNQLNYYEDNPGEVVVNFENYPSNPYITEENASQYVGKKVYNNGAMIGIIKFIGNDYRVHMGPNMSPRIIIIMESWPLPLDLTGRYYVEPLESITPSATITPISNEVPLTIIQNGQNNYYPSARQVVFNNSPVSQSINSSNKKKYVGYSVIFNNASIGTINFLDVRGSVPDNNPAIWIGLDRDWPTLNMSGTYYLRRPINIYLPLVNDTETSSYTVPYTVKTGVNKNVVVSTAQAPTFSPTGVSFTTRVSPFNNYIQIPTMNNATGYSICFSIYPTSFTGSNGFLYSQGLWYNNGGMVYAPSMYFNLSGSGTINQWYGKINGSGGGIATTQKVILNKWNSIVIVFKKINVILPKTGYLVNTYINGVGFTAGDTDMSGFGGMPGFNNTADGVYSIGDIYQNGGAFVGTMRDFSIIQSPLSAAQIMNLSTNITTPSSSPVDVLNVINNTPLMAPSRTPSRTPSGAPSLAPSGTPSRTPSGTPSLTPSGTPLLAPSIPPSMVPSPSTGNIYLPLVNKNDTSNFIVSYPLTTGVSDKVIISTTQFPNFSPEGVSFTTHDSPFLNYINIPAINTPVINNPNGYTICFSMFPTSFRNSGTNGNIFSQGTWYNPETFAYAAGIYFRLTSTGTISQFYSKTDGSDNSISTTQQLILDRWNSVVIVFKTINTETPSKTSINIYINGIGLSTDYVMPDFDSYLSGVYTIGDLPNAEGAFYGTLRDFSIIRSPLSTSQIINLSTNITAPNSTSVNILSILNASSPSPEYYDGTLELNLNPVNEQTNKSSYGSYATFFAIIGIIIYSALAITNKRSEHLIKDKNVEYVISGFLLLCGLVSLYNL